MAVLLYPLRLYTDFSGCMDIVIGAAEVFDIRLPENFRNPFFARTVQEIWQRWHITLGAWARDYVYYPTLKSAPIQALRRVCQARLGKRAGKFLSWAAGMAVLWFAIGLWHGAVQHVLGVSLYFWTVLVLSEWLSPVMRRATQRLGIRTQAFSWHLFQSVRTYVVYSLGVIFFSAGSYSGCLKRIGQLLGSFRQFDPWVLLDGSVLGLGVTYDDLNILIVGVLALLVVDALNEAYGSVRELIDRQNLPLRWALYYGLFFAVLLFGLYGPGYEASAFIYDAF